MPKSQKLLFVSLHKFCSRARRQHTRYIERAIFSRFVSARRRRARSSSSSEFLTLIWIGYNTRGRFFLSHRSGQSRRRDIISRDGARAHFPRAFAAALRRRFNEARAHTHTHRTKNRAHERTTAKTTTDRRRHALSSSSSCRKSPPNPSPNGRR